MPFSMQTTARFVCNAVRRHKDEPPCHCVNCMRHTHPHLVVGPRQQVHVSFPVDSELMEPFDGLYDQIVDYPPIKAKEVPPDKGKAKRSRRSRKS